MKIGIFSTFIDRDALKLVEDVQRSIQQGEIPNTEISFIFSNRSSGNNKTTDTMMSNLAHQETPLITFSSATFEPELRKTAQQSRNQGDNSLVEEWRNKYGDGVLRMLPPTDIDLLLGYMQIWGENMCDKRNGINLHPAIPGGPKGEWHKVIWELIQQDAKETGAMMHKVTPQLDSGPAVSYCQFSIRGYEFDSLWSKLPQEPNARETAIRQGISERGRSTNPLFRKIRDHGFARETPLIIQTTKAFAEGSVRIEGKQIVDKNGLGLKEGYDLTRQIDEAIKPTFEGNSLLGKEVKI